MSGVTSRTNTTFAISRSAQGGAASETVIQLGTQQVKFVLRRVKIKRVSGTAANLTPFVVNATGAASTSINKVWVGAGTAVGTLIDATPTQAYDVTDAAGKVYLVFGWDANVDNVADYELAFEILA